MAEAGVDIGGHRSKHVDDLKGVAFDYVVTVCDHANETCPAVPRPTQRLSTSASTTRPALAKDAADRGGGAGPLPPRARRDPAFVETSLTEDFGPGATRP